MPEAWAKLLLNSGISAAEKKKNPQGVIKALEFYTANSSGINDGETKFMTAQRYGECVGGYQLTWCQLSVTCSHNCVHTGTACTCPKLVATTSTFVVIVVLFG